MEKILKILTPLLVMSMLISCQNRPDEILYSTIPMTPDGGVYKMPCTINGLPLKFIFDTGASDVSISLTEASFMLKNDFISREDIGETEEFVTANGDIVEGVEILLRKVQIGDIVLENINASIVKTQNAPILLGQSVLNKLGAFIVDYKRNEIAFIKEDIDLASVLGQQQGIQKLINEKEKIKNELDIQSSYSDDEITKLRLEMSKMENELNSLIKDLEKERNKVKKLKRAESQSHKIDNEFTISETENVELEQEQTLAADEEWFSESAAKDKKRREESRKRVNEGVNQSSSTSDEKDRVVYQQKTSPPTEFIKKVRVNKSNVRLTTYAGQVILDDIGRKDKIYLLSTTTIKGKNYVFVRGYKGYIKKSILK